MNQNTTTTVAKTYAGSGSRELKGDSILFDKVVVRLIEMIEQTKPALLITGMAEGFDEALAIAAIATDTPLRAMIPNAGYGQHYWGKKSVTGRNRMTEFEYIIAYAQSTGGVEYVCDGLYGPDGRHANFHRNEAMAKACDKAWIYNPVTRGTAQFHKYCVDNNVPHYIIKIDGADEADTPQIPTPQTPKEGREMKKYLIKYPDGTEEVVASDKRASELAQELKDAGKSGVIKTLKEGNTMKIYHWIEESNVRDASGEIASDPFLKEEDHMVMTITNDPAPDRKQAFQDAQMGHGSAIYDQVNEGLYLMPVKTGDWSFHYLERLDAKGIKFTVVMRRLNLMRLPFDEMDPDGPSIGELLASQANLSWVDNKNLFLVYIHGVEPTKDFDWSLIGLSVKDAKKMTKRMAEFIRLANSGFDKNLKVKALSPESETDDPEFWVKPLDGKNAIKFSSLPENMQTILRKRGHLHLMGRGFTKAELDGIVTNVLVKGDFVVVPDYLWPWGDIDVAAHVENLKTEVTLADPRENDLWTFWEHAPLHVTTWDQQTMLNYPNVFPVSRMREDYMVEMTTIDQQLAKGLLPGQVESDHQVQAEEEAHDEFKRLMPKADEVRKNRNLASKVKDAGFDVRMFENLVFFSVNGYAESKARFLHTNRWDRYGNPDPLFGMHDKHVVTMRNSFRATVVTDTFLKEFVNMDYTDNRVAFYDPNVGMVWNGEHFARSFELHGTHDNDDTHFFVPVKLYSTSKVAVHRLKKAGVMLDNVQIPAKAENAKMMLLVFRLPNGAGEYSIMEFDFTTWPKEIPFDESLVETHNLDFAKEWVKPQPMVIPANMPGLPTSRIYSKQSYTRADLLMDMKAQFCNPGFGAMCNALVTYSSITKGGIPSCMTDSLGNIVDATQQGADIKTFEAITDLMSDIKDELVTMGTNSTLFMNRYFYFRRGAVAKKAMKNRVIDIMSGDIERFDAEYKSVYTQLKNNAKNKYSFAMRSAVPLNQKIMNMVFSEQQMRWAKEFILEMDSQIKAVADIDTGLPVSKFTKPIAQAILREKRHEIVDAAIAKIESLKDPNGAILCIWHMILKPYGVSPQAKHGYPDRVICQMGSERALAHLLIDAIVDMQEKRKLNVGANKIVFTNSKVVDGAFVNHVVKDLQAERATQIPVDIMSDIIGKIPQGFNFVWIMADDKPLAVFKRQNSTFVEIIADLPQTIKV